jgi:hypothetical protein
MGSACVKQLRRRTEITSIPLKTEVVILPACADQPDLNFPPLKEAEPLGPAILLSTLEV